jgi:hypothetical protein
VSWRILGGEVFHSASGSQLDFTVTVDGRPLTPVEVYGIVEGVRRQAGGATLAVWVGRAETHSVVRAFISSRGRREPFPLGVAFEN